MILPEGAATARIMGIVNVTPDSFSDGGRFMDMDAAMAAARSGESGLAIFT